MGSSPLPAPEITAGPPSADPAAWLLPSGNETALAAVRLGGS